MATPTISQAVSTPKNPLATTPSRLMASPRPGTAAAASKPFAYKSPAVKTPASLHGHGHQISVSSHPSSTPLAPGAIHDELLALNSPAAALLNSIGPTGLTPLSTSQDGLGIGQLQGTLTRDGQPARNPEAERVQNLQRVADILKSKVIGQGITRDGVERVATLQGFEALWDEDNLTIAGNVVELDMNFDGVNKDKVRDLVLKVNSATGEPQVQPRASDILKKDLGVGERSSLSTLPQNLDAFASNLQYLSQLDHINPNVNCFEIIGGLSNVFKNIWEEEKKRMKWHSEAVHICSGNIGRPVMDRLPKLGLSLEYWKARRRTAQVNYGVERSKLTDIWSGRISCEAGSPSITSAQKWLSEDVLRKVSQAENVLDASDEDWKPEWQDPLQQSSTSDNNPKTDNGEMDVDKPDLEIPQPMNISFVYSLEAEVLIPIGSAMGLNNEVNMIDIDQTMAITYQQALQNLRNSKLNITDPQRFESRWQRSLIYIDANGNKADRKHSYALYPSPVGAELWFYPVSKLKFNHPRQIATIIPILRQYAALWNLMHILTTHPELSSSEFKPQPVANGSKIPENKGQVRKRSNKKQSFTGMEGIVSTREETSRESALPIDISLDVISDPTKPRLDIIVPTENLISRSLRSPFVHLSIIIELNGKLDVIQVEGLKNSDSTHLNSKLGKILDLTEDIGMSVQWLIESFKP